jgi:hypothetical protein
MNHKSKFKEFSKKAGSKRLSTKHSNVNWNFVANDSKELRTFEQKYRKLQQMKKASRNRNRTPSYARNTVAYIAKCI